jgi:hypothetical protein
MPSSTKYFNVVQYDDGLRPIYQQCIAQAKNKLPATVDYMLITYSHHKPRNNDYRAMSDIIRLNQAAAQPNMIWLDSDVLIKKWIDFDLLPGKVYINDRTASVIIVNGCTEFFAKLWRIYEQTEELDYPGWLQRLLFKHGEGKIEYLPKEYFVHCELSHAIFAGAGFSNYGTKDYTISKDDKGELQLKVSF